MEKEVRLIGQKTGKAKAVALFLSVLCISFIGWSQESAKVLAQIDTASIRIGEQIKYKITVETDSLNIVYFPEDQTFSPLEMVEALSIDTTKNKDRITLQRIYALTQFDSGAYTIPPQRIAINEQPFFTDSFQIKVANVVVDTTKQKMFDIKPLIQVERSNTKLWQTLLWILLGLMVIGGLVWWFFLRKKELTEEEKVALLPPYDRALLQLKELENSRYLIQDEYKAYYSELTGIVRSYLDEDVHISALESTTDQLIERLELLKDAGELNIEDDTISQFKQVLQTADLVKFAKSKPPTNKAEQDRAIIENIVVKTKEALPEPDAEELLQNEAYLEELAKKKQRKRIIIAAASLLGVLLVASAAAIASYGFKQVKDTVLGHPTKELLEGEWVESTYGFPPIGIETPKVLLRQEVELPAEIKEQIKDIHVFGYQSTVGLFTVLATSTTFVEAAEPDFDKPIEELLRSFEQQGAKNIITKQEEFNTQAGVKGIKTFGSGKFKIPSSDELVKGKYAILSFGGKGFMQQIVIIWLDDDTYAEQIVERVLASVDVKTQA
ncbi:BatD family protein [Croceitalea dokdonensis]|nr:BatD family protein [Croceitalea dokdonensis]